MNKNKRKINIISILIAIIIIIAISIVIFNLFIKEKYKVEVKKDEFVDIAGIWKVKPTSENRTKRRKEIEQKLQNQEDIIENAIVEDDYMKLKICFKEKIETYYLGYVGEQTINLLITGLGNAIGYKIETNKIEIADKSIKIDFNSDSAPFKVETQIFSDYFQNINITDKREIAICIFNSIDKTIKENYGQDIKVYYSKNNEDIIIDDVNPKIEINKNKEFKQLSY